MRKLILALFLALAAITAGISQAAAMEGFDLGDMPPLPPPLLDDSPTPPPLSPPAGGSMSPLVQGGNTSSAGLTPMAPPPGATPSVPPVGADVGGMDFASPLPPAPPLAPPPVVGSDTTAGSLAPPPAVGTGSVSLPAQLGGQGGSQTQPASLAPVVPETPRLGRIDGGRVNVRAGPNTQYESIAVLTTGAPVTVLARHGEWLKIAFPEDQLASIHKSMVTADITGEIPEAGLPGVVNQDNANVHAFYWDKSTVVGTLNKGAPVIIKQERGQWYRIAAPENARAYVFAKYVRIDGNQEVAVDAAPAPVNPSIDLTASTDGDGKAKPVKLSKDQERVLEIKESYYKRLRERLEAEREAEEAAAKAAAEAKKLQANQLDSALKDLESRLVAIDQEKTQRIDYVTREFMPPQQTMISGFGAASWAPPDPVGGGYTGWVENIGRVGGAPTPYRLTKGGEIRFYLVSDQFNLEEFTNRRVWLNGQIENAGVMKVDQIRILTELEIADSMSRQQAGGYGAAPAGDPYGAGSYGGGYDMSGYGAVAEYGPGGQPLDSSYGAPSYAAPTGPDPFAGYGSDYTQGATYSQTTTTTTYSQPPVGGADPFAGYGSGYGAPQMFGDPNAGVYTPAGREPGTADLVVSPDQLYGSSASAPTSSYSTYESSVTTYGGSYDPGTNLGVPSSGSFQSAPLDSFGGSYQAVPTPVPGGSAAQGGIRPSDPSQLPDVVGGVSQYYGGSTSVDVGGGMTVGEVDTDRYERPIISEIAP